MKQIKYKAWDLKHKCWFKNTSDNLHAKFGSKDDYLEDLFISMTGIPCLHIAESAHNMTIEQSRERPDYLVACPAQFEIVRYTGLHDKNGKEIYWGDLFEVVICDMQYMMGFKGKHITKIGEVKMINGCWVVEFKDENNDRAGKELYKFLKNDKEIIGNKFENKDLLSN